MTALLIFLLILSIAFNVVSVIRYREAEMKARVLQSMTDKNSDFTVEKKCTPEGVITQCSILIRSRRAIPIVADLTGITLSNLADEFDRCEKKNEPCIIETRVYEG